MSGSLRRCAEAVSNRPSVFVSGVTLAVVALGLVNVLTAARQASADPELADLRILVDWLQSADPYARFEDTSLQVDYPPHARLILFPLTVVPWDTLRWLWPWFSVACLIVAGWGFWTWSCHVLADRVPVWLRSWPGGVLATGLLLATHASRVAIVWGHNSPVFLATLAWTLVLARSSPRWASVSFAVTVIKPNTAALAGWVLWRDHRRLLWMMALLVVAATAGAAWHFHTSPWAAVRDYVMFLAHSYADEPARNDILGFRRIAHAVVGQVWGAHVASRLVAVTAIAAGAVAVGLAWRRPRQPIAGIITTWTAGLLWLPHGPYQLGLCLPVVWLVAFAPDAVGLTPRRARVLAGLLVWLLVSNLPAGWESPLWPLPLEKALSDVPIHSLADECIRVPILACHVLAVRRLWRPASTSS